MKKIILVIVMVMFFAVSGCGQPKIDENAMPDVVFEYFKDEHTNEQIYDNWFIDKGGGLYHVINGEVYGTAQLREDYKTLLKDVCVCVGEIEYEELVEKYKILREVSVSDKNIVEIHESFLDWGEGTTEEWSGYCYDKKGNIVIVSLHGEGDYYYTNEDPRAGELAKWMDTIVQEAMEESGQNTSR